MVLLKKHILFNKFMFHKKMILLIITEILTMCKWNQKESKNNYCININCSYKIRENKAVNKYLSEKSKTIGLNSKIISLIILITYNTLLKINIIIFQPIYFENNWVLINFFSLLSFLICNNFNKAS